MGLDDFSPEIESSEGVGQSSEAIKEASEKYKEASKKAGAKIAKTAKDEKKAKKYDFLLAGFLVKIIVDKKYDFLLDTLFPAIHSGYPSNFILGILSLIHLEISHKIRETSGKEIVQFDYKVKSETEVFDDNHIDPIIKNRINYWIEDIIDSVTVEYSHIQTEKLIQLLKEDNNLLLEYTSKIFSFFLQEINISITKEKSDNISEFILTEVSKAINNLDLKEI